MSTVKNSDKYYILNLLTGNADILEHDKAQDVLNNSVKDETEFKEKGYIMDEESEKSLYKNAYLNFIEDRDSSEIQIFFVPWYSCNYACQYCYQDEYENSSSELTKELVDYFFSFVSQKFSGRKKYITIFGGEPLLSGPKHKEKISWILDGSKKQNLDVAIVTNGYNVSEYIDLLKQASIREIQITLDGTEDIHNIRRPLKGGGPTFEKIVEGVDLLLKETIPVNLRVVVDKDNLQNLSDLAYYAKEKGWTDNKLFKTQLGRNYELHHCQGDPNRLYDRLSLYEKIYNMIDEHPVIMEFHKPSFSVSKFLWENGELPQPLFDACPGGKTEWAFDYRGSIYACTATVGKKGEELGTYYPEVELFEDEIDIWEDRDVTAIKECKDCSVQHLCGAGCGAVAKNRTGTVLSPDCRPVKELMELGISLYFNKGEI